MARQEPTWRLEEKLRGDSPERRARIWSIAVIPLAAGYRYLEMAVHGLRFRALPNLRVRVDIYPGFAFYSPRPVQRSAGRGRERTKEEKENDMETLLIIVTLLVITLIAFIPVIMKQPKDAAELKEENGYLKEIIHHREDKIASLEKQLSEEKRP